ncbi:unnamed protein product [Boreogadus saida]
MLLSHWRALKQRVPLGECQCHFVEVARRTKFGVIEHVEQLTPSPVEGKLMASPPEDTVATPQAHGGDSWGVHEFELHGVKRLPLDRGVKMNPLSDAAININRCTDGAPHSHVVP